MRMVMKRLHEAQPALLGRRLESPKSVKIIAALQPAVPVAVLAHFLKFIRSGRNGVAVVRHGVCSECHIRVCSSLVTTLTCSPHPHLCEHCGRFLLLPDDEMTGTKPALAASR